MTDGRVIRHPILGTGRTSNGLAVAGFTLALCAVVFFWVPILDFVLSVLGIVFSAVGLSRAKARRSPGRGLAIAGLSIALVAIVLSIVVTLSLFVVGFESSV